VVLAFDMGEMEKIFQKPVSLSERAAAFDAELRSIIAL